MIFSRVKVVDIFDDFDVNKFYIFPSEVELNLDCVAKFDNLPYSADLCFLNSSNLSFSCPINTTNSLCLFFC